MFIHAKLPRETIDLRKSDVCNVVVYIPPQAIEDGNMASLCVWIVPGTVEED